MSPTLPPERSADQRGAEAIILGLANSIPLAGNLLAAGIQQGLAAGQEAVLRQFLTELVQAPDRFLTRLGDVELEAFLARKESAAAINQATQIALKTPSREKHALLGRAVLNAATAHSEDGLIPFLWTLVDKHSALKIRLLASLDDPLNRAIDRDGGGYVHAAVSKGLRPHHGRVYFSPRFRSSGTPATNSLAPRTTPTTRTRKTSTTSRKRSTRKTRRTPGGCSTT